MSSPFPGMDPYLEPHWGDVHASLVVYARDELQGRLPDVLRIRAEEYRSAYVEPGDVEPRTERRLKIVDTTADHRVVTVIEFLSPWNKRSPGCEAYRAKQRNLLDGGVNLVEIDLTRSGSWVLAAPEAEVPDDYHEPYAICVKRPGMASFEMYRASFREPLPTIRVPLRIADPDAPLALQPLVDRAYEASGYEFDLDYSRTLRPRLSREDEQWVHELLADRGLS